MGSAASTAARAEDRCPVDHKNMSAAELEGMMAQHKRHSPPAPASAQSADSLRATDPAPASGSKDAATAPADGCPVDHRNMSKEQLAAYMSHQRRKPMPMPVAEDEQGGTVEKATPGHDVVYDVYGQHLDRANLMPSTPNQLPAPGQSAPLSTDRVKSTIPKAGVEEDGSGGDTWTYPSPQMFYNALKRKGKADGVAESDMDHVVAVHNDMNEKTWREVMQWEQLFHCDCPNPKLKQFQGRPHDLSPAARFRVWFRGYPMPFDRHDWVVDRCGKGQARYIIDYYYRDRPDPIEIHVRPALDSPTAFFDRLRNGAMSARDSILGATPSPATAEEPRGIVAPPSLQDGKLVSGEALDADEFAFLSGLTPKGIQEIAVDVQKSCEKVGAAFRDAGNDPAKMEQANISVNYCMAQRICKTQAADFMSALESHGDEAVAYGKMTSCLERFHIMARRALLEASGIVQDGPEFPAGVTAAVGGNANRPKPVSNAES